MNIHYRLNIYVVYITIDININIVTLSFVSITENIVGTYCVRHAFMY